MTIPENTVTTSTMVVKGCAGRFLQARAFAVLQTSLDAMLQIRTLTVRELVVRAFPRPGWKKGCYWSIICTPLCPLPLTTRWLEHGMGRYGLVLCWRWLGVTNLSLTDSQTILKYKATQLLWTQWSFDLLYDNTNIYHILELWTHHLLKNKSECFIVVTLLQQISNYDQLP